MSNTSREPMRHTLMTDSTSDPPAGDKVGGTSNVVPATAALVEAAVSAEPSRAQRTANRPRAPVDLRRAQRPADSRK